MHLHRGLTNIGFEQSAYEECLYFKDDTILLLPGVGIKWKSGVLERNM